MSLTKLADRAAEVAEAQPRLINLVQHLIEVHGDFNLTDDQHAELQGITNEVMGILLELDR